jgi:hypothetical protein
LAASAEPGTKDALRVASLVLFHWSTCAIQCASTSLLALLHLFQNLIRRPDTAQILRVLVGVSTELLKCAAYIGFARRSGTLAAVYAPDFFLWLYLMWRLVREFKRQRAATRWVMELPMPTEAQLRGEGEPPTVTLSPPAITAAAAIGPTPPAPGSDEPAQCAICYDGIGDNPQSARCLPCGHIFHVQCLSRWLEKNDTCPCCGRDMGALQRMAYIAAVKAQIAAIDAEIAALKAQMAQTTHARDPHDAVAGS